MAPLLVRAVATKPDGTTTVKIGLSPGAIIAAALAGGILALVGLGIMAVDGYVAIEAKQPLHTVHLAIGGGFVFVGVVVAFGHFVINPITQLLIVIGRSSLPVIGGKRWDDPKLPPGTDEKDESGGSQP